MLDRAIIENFAGEPVADTQDFGLWVSNPADYRCAIPFLSHTRIRALLVLKSRSIPFSEAVSALRTKVDGLARSDSKKCRNCRCDWAVCSEAGGIYLYEALATKEHKKLGGMRHRFTVFNSLTGVVSFGPGHVLNERYSERFAELLLNSRLYTRPEWIDLTGRLFQAAMDRNSL